MPTDTKPAAIAIVAEVIAPYTPRETARELADKVIAALGARFDLVERAPASILEEIGAPRCKICGWPLQPTIDKGCTEESCSYRPAEGSAEFYRIQARRAELAGGARD